MGRKDQADRFRESLKNNSSSDNMKRLIANYSPNRDRLTVKPMMSPLNESKYVKMPKTKSIKLSLNFDEMSKIDNHSVNSSIGNFTQSVPNYSIVNSYTNIQNLSLRIPRERDV